MPTNFKINPVPKGPPWSISGVEFCVWSYQLSWDAADAPSGRLALVFPGSIDIQDPSVYPEEPAIQGSALFRSAAEDKFYVSVLVPPAPQLNVNVSFIAPSASSATTPLTIVRQDPTTESWSTLPFSVGAGADNALVQMVEGPAESMGLVPPSPHLGKARAASRRVPKATLVSLQVPSDQLSREEGAAVEKYNFLQRLRLSPGEVDSLATHLQQDDRDALATIRSFEGLTVSSALPTAREVAHLPTSILLKFGQMVVQSRKALLPRGDPAERVERPASVLSGKFGVGPEFNETISYHDAFTALEGFRNAFEVSPIGVLNLERLEMTPAGTQRGELIATIPLAPKEKTTVTHKEWSVTSREFTSIVTDSLENYSETGVTENSELAHATTSQTTHSNQFNVNATLSGTFGPVTATVSTGFGSQDSESHSASESRRHAVTTTRQASSRVKQEHKVTVSTTTTTGTLDSTMRVLENTSAINPIRVDYFSLLRKWHVSLYRYGLRLTYDIAVPEPGAAMRTIYAKLDDLRLSLGKFEFNVNAAEITSHTYLDLAYHNDVVLPSPPEDPKEISISTTYTEPGDTTTFGTVRVMEIIIPDGYIVESADLFALQESDVNICDIKVARMQYPHGNLLIGGALPIPYLVGREGTQYLMYYTKGSPSGALTLELKLRPTETAISNWQQQTWAVLFGAAQAKYYAAQQKAQAEIETLTAQISNVNTLTLRREENEEIMKAALKWLLGPTFAFMPDDVLQAFVDQSNEGNPWGGVDLAHGSTAYETGLSVTPNNWGTMLMHQEMIKFINQAIEWENVLSFVYPYFWDIPSSWSFIRGLRHPDATREAFLRAGSARVVLTVRRGWEEAWVTFVETGGFGDTLLPTHPYLSIAREVQAYDQTNYPGIPPANPGGGPLPDDGTTVSTVSADVLIADVDPVDIQVQSSEGFRVGYTAVIDSYSNGATVGGIFTTNQESQVITSVTTGQITVERLLHGHDGSVTPIAIRQAGEAGHLMAEWFEYTPTPGTDIAVTSNLATIV
ncbi:hypothetical protein [Rhodococcus wratislaviensis]|uniref:Uncharacterized protein n=1 Tax=Rhodococcus wratislaviensis NBRC 100605 TaxID=1219028 RepID=X0R3N7_RHOWR|nr:hypothetical protein [Rhodococcus wratislaviensis]GAF45490.1 hypothetical protein RW1_022_00670 [Rhodococcus wratislaviensis NBRC 100605]